MNWNVHSHFFNFKTYKKKRPVVFTLMLTSLIDAFSILVIYLIFSFSNVGEILYMSPKIELPLASQSASLIRDVVLKLEENIYYIENQKVKKKDLANSLLKIYQKYQEKVAVHKSQSLIVQADKNTLYESLSPILVAAHFAGFQNIQFAVIGN